MGTKLLLFVSFAAVTAVAAIEPNTSDEGYVMEILKAMQVFLNLPMPIHFSSLFLVVLSDPHQNAQFPK